MITEEAKDRLFGLLCLVFIVGLYTSKALLSIVPYVILALGLFRKNLPTRFKTFLKTPAYWCFAVLFLLYVFSGINSEDTASWFRRLDNHLVYVILPLGFALNAPISTKVLHGNLFSFFLVSVLAAAAVLLNYYLDFSQANENYLKGKTLETPILHARFAMFIAGAIACGIYLWVKRFSFRKGNLPYFIVVGIGFLIFFLHIFAVRTGLLSFYFLAIFTLFYFVFKKGEYLKGVVGLLGIIALPVISYFMFPSVKNKLSYVTYDWQTILKGGDAEHLSDNTRIRSLQNGLELFRESPWLGTGVGDMPAEMSRKYDQNYPQMSEAERFLPTNQVVFILTGFGIIGLIWFLAAFLTPLFHQSNYKHYGLMAFYIVVGTSCIGENSVELILGKSFFLIIALTFIALYNASDRKKMPWLT